MSSYEFMETLTKFKAFMTSYNVPDYVVQYCGRLSNQKWEWFYGQVNEAIKFTANVEYLFYLMKWILKRDFDDLSYELYLYYCIDEDIHYWDTIDIGWLGCLQDRYEGRLEKDVRRKRSIDQQSLDFDMYISDERACIMKTILTKQYDLSTRGKRRRAISLVLEFLERIRVSEEIAMSRVPGNLRGGDAYLAAENSIDCINDAVYCLLNAY